MQLIFHSNILFFTATSKKATTICSNVIQYWDTRTSGTATATRKWDLYSAVCLERHPVIIQSMQEIELKFHNMLKKVQYENSLKCDYELKVEREKEQKKLHSSNMNIDGTDIIVQTAQDFEDNYQEELNNFKFAPTVTSMR